MLSAKSPWLFGAAKNKISNETITANNYWSSTQYSSNNAWKLNWNNGNFDWNNKNNNNYVRAVCALNKKVIKGEVTHFKF